MATYYVNSVGISPEWGCGCESDWDHDYIGLFTKPDATIHSGNFCGYYSYEAYKNTTLIAFYRQGEGHQGCYKPSKRNGPTYRVNKHFTEKAIGSGMWTCIIEAKDDEEAIEKFEKHGWEKGSFVE